MKMSSERYWSEARLERLRRDYATCESVSELAKALGTTVKCAYAQAARMGLVRERPSPPGPHVDQPAAVHIVETALRARPELQQLITEKWRADP
jgi:hypothetical protein